MSTMNYLSVKAALQEEASSFDPECEPFRGMEERDVFQYINTAHDCGDIPAMARGYIHLWSRQPTVAIRLELATALLVGLDLANDPEIGAWYSDNAAGLSRQAGFSIRSSLEGSPLPEGLLIAEVLWQADRYADTFCAAVRSSPFVRKLAEDSQADYAAHGW